MNMRHITRSIMMIMGGRYFWLMACWALLLFSIPSCSYGPESLDIPSTVEITETRTYLHFSAPNQSSFKTGFLFYPGGLVDPHVYDEWLSDLAEDGMEVVVVKMPVNLAVLGINRGVTVMEDFPDIEQWVIGGHSLGGAMACSVIERNRDAFLGLILLAAYPGQNTELSDWDRPVLSLSAEFDGLTLPEDLEQREDLLPSPYKTSSIFDWPDSLSGRTVYYQIPGGNHGQFGTYAPQGGDGTATITQDEQHLELITWIDLYFQLNQWK